MLNHELVIENYAQGIKLIRPDAKNHLDCQSNHSQRALNRILKLPFNVVFENTDSMVQDCNEAAVQTCGFTSINSALGKTVADVARQKESVNHIFNHDKTGYQHSTDVFFGRRLFTS